jgi:hypothetical protein
MDNILNNESFTDYILDESLRQLSTMDSVASTLTTKSSLYMVFAAFIFTAEIGLVTGKPQIFSGVNYPLSFVAIVFSLVSILFLLSSASLREWGMPPRAEKFRDESEKHFAHLVSKGDTEQGALLKLKTKYINSLARSVEKNHAANAKTAAMLVYASRSLLLSIVLLLSSMVFPLVPVAWKAVARFF